MFHEYEFAENSEERRAQDREFMDGAGYLFLLSNGAWEGGPEISIDDELITNEKNQLMK